MFIRFFFFRILVWWEKERLILQRIALILSLPFQFFVNCFYASLRGKKKAKLVKKGEVFVFLLW